MTTDPFTDAARAEAKRLDDQYDLEWEGPHNVFVRAAVWARTRLAAQEPTDAEVDAAAAVIWESYDLLDRAAIRDALSAARREEEKR